MLSASSFSLIFKFDFKFFFLLMITPMIFKNKVIAKDNIEASQNESNINFSQMKAIKYIKKLLSKICNIKKNLLIRYLLTNILILNL